MLQAGDTLVLATRNAGKLREIEAALGALPLVLRPISDFTNDEPIEDGGSYEANAAIKAQAAFAASGLPSLADDAGLEADALPNDFGVESAPFAASLGGWPQAMQALAARITAGAPATARHRVTYALCANAGPPLVFGATVAGRLVYPARGDDWGFNPYFLPDGETRTYSEILSAGGMAAKNAASARGRALAQVVAHLQAKLQP